MEGPFGAPSLWWYDPGLPDILGFSGGQDGKRLRKLERLCGGEAVRLFFSPPIQGQFKMGGLGSWWVMCTLRRGLYENFICGSYQITSLEQGPSMSFHVNCEKGTWKLKGLSNCS